MLSIPVIKDIVRGGGGGRVRAGTAFVFRAEAPADADSLTYLLHLATHLETEVLAFIQVGARGAAASIDMAGTDGLTSRLTLPSLDNGGPLAALVRGKSPAAGKARLFTSGEVFPHEGDWCDLVPMDSEVWYFFHPLRSQDDPRPPRSFILVAERGDSVDEGRLALKAVAAAALVSLRETHLTLSQTGRLVEHLEGFLGREGYLVGIVDREGRISTQQEEVPAGLDLTLLEEQVAGARPGKGSREGPLVIETEDLEAVTYPLPGRGSPDPHLVIARRRRAAASDQDPETRRMIGRFMSSIAHEIKNPLTGISAGIQYLSKKLQSGVSEKETVEFILAEIGRLNRIVDDLYRISKPPELVFDQTNVNDVVEKSLLCLSEEILRKRITISQDLASNLPSIQADAERIQQVIINLLKNSVEACPEEGKVELITARAEDRVLITVRDSGPGIPEEERRRVFEPFYSTKQKGSGLGLAISRTIVESHGGTISVEGRAGRGATFVIRLPESS
jgi:signal transduction histidine kinase